MALLLAQMIELTSLRTAQQGTMSGDDIFNVVLLKANTHSQHVALFSMASSCSKMAAAALRFKDDHPDLKLINHLVNWLKLTVEFVLNSSDIHLFTERELYYGLPENAD